MVFRGVFVMTLIVLIAMTRELEKIMKDKRQQKPSLRRQRKKRQ